MSESSDHMAILTFLMLLQQQQHLQQQQPPAAISTSPPIMALSNMLVTGSLAMVWTGMVDVVVGGTFQGLFHPG